MVIAAPAPTGGPRPTLTDADRARSLRETRARAPAGEDDVWVFGYGSLMWRPGFTFDRRERALLGGYRRRFCTRSTRARGTPERPGLGLGLEPGEGTCVGVGYRLAPETLEADLQVLWRREMGSGIYRPTWVELEAGGASVHAIAFVIDRSHPGYLGVLTVEAQADLVVGARGRAGPCSEYVANTVRELARLGVSEPELDALLALVERRTAAGGA